MLWVTLLKMFCWVWNLPHVWRKTGENDVWYPTPVPIYFHPGLGSLFWLVAKCKVQINLIQGNLEIHQWGYYHCILMDQHWNLSVNTLILCLEISLRSLFRPRVVDLSFIVIFMQKPQSVMRWLFDYFSRFVKNFLCDFKRSLSTRTLFKNNFIKWKTKQSSKGNLWKYLYILPIFFTWGRK